MSVAHSAGIHSSAPYRQCRLPFHGGSSVSVLDSTSSSSLISRVKRQDEVAWDRLVAIYGPTVYHWGLAAGLQSADASDVMQETFEAVARRIKDFCHDASGSTFRGWLWTIYRSKVMNFFREQQTRLPISADYRLEQLEAAVDAQFESVSDQAREKSLLLQRALEVIRNDFSEKTWSAFWRSVIENQRTRDIALSLGISSAAVCVARTRVVRRLRETLSGLSILPDE